MKKFFLFIICLGLITLSSCDSEDSSLIVSTENLSVSTDAISDDSLFNIGHEKFANWENGSEIITTRSSITPVTIYGYTSSTSTGNKKVIFNETVRKYLGLYNQVYIAETLTLYYKVTISGLNTTTYFTYAESPLCGMSPNDSNIIGYSYSQDGNTVTLATKVHHIICDLSGKQYNMWYPCKPEDLQWNYNLIFL